MSLSLGEARARAAQLSAVTYEIDLDLTDPHRGSFGCRTTVGFASSGPETFLELTSAEDLAVTVNGARTDAEYDGRRIALTGLVTSNEVVVEARLPYVTDGDGMHTFTDPADGETYVSAYLGMDIAQRVFACFDQNDLKAPITLRVTADPAWTVLANGVASQATPGRWVFTTTPPIPAPIFVVCAGRWHSRTWEHAGLPFGWHARRSLAAELDRDFDELRATTVACFDHYAELITEPYPFDSYAQAFVPGQNWGAQEMPGCVTYRDELLPRGRLTGAQQVGRATIIAHEMAHMWFGDLVTMRWWEDTWLQESFADYMGYRVAHEAAGFEGTLLRHEGLRKPAAYDADQRRSTHPVAPEAEDVPDVDAAANNFDAISYAKGNSVIRQLVTWLGDETFLAGVNVYLSRHRFGNTTLHDFVTALDEASESDVHAWMQVWLRESGFDTLRVTRDGDVPVITREGTRPHRLRVTAYDAKLVEVESRFVDVTEAPVRLNDWARLSVVPNSHGETFARIRLDEQSWSQLTDALSHIDDDLVRTVLWTTVFDLVQQRELSTDDYLGLVARQLPAEPHVVNATAVVRHTLEVVLPRRVPVDRAPAAVAVVAAACETGLSTRPADELAIELVRGLARTSWDANLLQGWLSADQTQSGIALDPTLRWTVVRRLAEIGAADTDLIERERRDDGNVDGELGAARALAARPTSSAKAQAWAAIAGDASVSNRMFEALADGLWSSEQADLLAPYVAAYFAEGGRLAARGQAFAQVVGGAFPALPLAPEQVQALEAALSSDLPTVLRRKWEDRLDDLR